MNDRIHDDVRRYYDGRLAEHGPTPAGVDWNSDSGQRVRFHQLTVGLRPDESILDVGCGYGALLDHLRADRPEWHGRYRGVDLSPAMIDAAVERHGSDGRFSTELPGPRSCDRVVASGLFNVKGDEPDESWTSYVFDTLETMFECCRETLAFNVLTGYPDPGHRRSDLYYPAPGALLDLCATRLSRRFMLDHDYGLFECTITVRRET